MILYIATFFSVFLSTFILTGIVRRYALKKGMLDTPNKRSSHSIDMPRGGGVSIAIVFFISLFVLYFSFESNQDYSTISSLYVGGLIVATVGFLDDHGDVPTLWRLLAHFIAAICALALLGGLPPLTVFSYIVNLGWFGHSLSIIYLVWLLNLYNFMDGIDGIAGIEAVTVCIGGLLIYLINGQGPDDWMPLILLMSSVIGFLFWNFPKARIFMGDSGSGFVGLMLGIFSIQAAWVAPELFWTWVILLGAFVVDATLTLLRRILRGDKFYEAHRSHAYQYASRKYGAHYLVSLAFGGINLFWLFPIAVLVSLGWLDGLLGILLAYVPLIILAFHFKAGAKELQEI